MSLIVKMTQHYKMQNEKETKTNWDKLKNTFLKKFNLKVKKTFRYTPISIFKIIHVSMVVH